MLAAKTEDGGPGNVGMVEITRNQTAEIAGVFPSAATAGLMYQKLDAVDVLENPTPRLPARALFHPLPVDLFESAFLVKPHQVRDLLPVDLRGSEAELLFESLFQHLDVPVFTEHQRNHQPVVSGAHLSV